MYNHSPITPAKKAYWLFVSSVLVEMYPGIFVSWSKYYVPNLRKFRGPNSSLKNFDFPDYSSEGRIFANMENKAITIRPVSGNKKQFLDLLLLGDEQESMIDRYLEQGDMFALYDGDLKSVCVVIAIGDSICELKNIATYEKYRGQGYGNALIHYLFDYYKDKYKTMLAGTGDMPSTLSFYKRCGFEPSHRIKNFFTDNYDHPMFEDGVQLVDMVYLKRNL